MNASICKTLSVLSHNGNWMQSKNCKASNIALNFKKDESYLDLREHGHGYGQI